MKTKRDPWWRRLFRPRLPDFYGQLGEQGDHLVQALQALEDFLQDNQAEKAERVRDLVDAGHALARQNLDDLHRTFVTPIDREDLYAIINAVDHVFDYVMTAVREIELLEVPGDRWMRDMIDELQKGATALREGFRLFAKDPAAGGAKGDEARHAEREVEEHYRQALGDMFGGRALEAIREREDLAGSSLDCLDYVFAQMKRREVYRHLSNGADRLARVGELLHDFGVKYG
ncbi:MAG: DUF47 family protein [Verrucomicrobiae bacterium]|nr:DUF47 family protein [Verrucomicrobiae bacterium]